MENWTTLVFQSIHIMEEKLIGGKNKAASKITWKLTVRGLVKMYINRGEEKEKNYKENGEKKSADAFTYEIYMAAAFNKSRFQHEPATY